MKITKQWLTKHHACCSEEEKVEAEKIGDVKEICKRLLDAKRFNDTNWLLTRLLKKDDLRRYAIFSAESVLFIYENKYPDDNRPRRAIEAAKKYLKCKSRKNKNAARAAADAAADAAAAAFADAYAAYAAYATYAAVYAAYATYAAVHAAADDATIISGIVSYGLKLLFKE